MRLFCSICQDIYLPGSEVHVTNCGHLYHAACISTWMKQRKTCPQCRANVAQPFRIYFDVQKSEETDKAILERHLEVLMNKLRQAERCKKTLREENKNLEKIAEEMKECAASLTEKNNHLKFSVDTMKQEVLRLSRKNKILTDLESELASLKSKVSGLKSVEALINDAAEEVNKMIESTPVTEQAVRQLCLYVGVLKDQLNKMEAQNVRLNKEKRDISRALAEEKQKSGTEELIRSLTEKNKKLENDLSSLNALLEDYKTKYARKVKQFCPPRTFSNKLWATRTALNLNLDDLFEEEDKSTKVVPPAEPDRTIKKWEELVCAGPVQNLVPPKNRSFGTTLQDKENKDTSNLAENYAFDGLGGRKKIRLGGPTPVDEFKRLKEKNAKKGVKGLTARATGRWDQMKCAVKQR